MTPRSDISKKLAHFTSGTSLEDAYDRLQSIITERRLRGSGEKIRGGFFCVCFTEAPLPSLQHGLVNPLAYSRYSPFGIIFDKQWIFERGGRPVIYQSDAEFDDLPDSMKWRHVRYEPLANPPIDFTWEREWRLRSNSVQFSPSDTGIIVPDRSWAERIGRDHEGEQEFLVQMYSQVLDEILAEQYREAFPWRIYPLK